MRANQQPGIGYAEAVDEYLHVIVRTRPWTKKSEEDALEAFGEWLGGELGDGIGLSVAVAEVARYREDAGLSDSERERLRSSVEGLVAWAVGTGMLRQ